MLPYLSIVVNNAAINIGLEKAMAPTPVLLPRKSHGRRSLVGCSPWGHEESDMTERLPFHFSLSCIGEGNGNPLQCSCLENPRDGGAWWAAICGVAQSWTRLKRLSSSKHRIHVSFLIGVFRYMPRSEIAGSYGRSVLALCKWVQLFLETVRPDSGT